MMLRFGARRQVVLLSSLSQVSVAVARPRRHYQQAGSTERVERQVQAQGAPAAMNIEKEMAKVDPARIDKVAVWGLWNEGNLFSLTVPELAAFLSKEGVAPPAELRKSGLVRQVEDVMATFSPPTTTPTDDTVASITSAFAASSDPYAPAAAEAFDDTDDYGDWGADPSFEDRRGLDFMALAVKKSEKAVASKTGHLASHAFQLLHEEASANVALSQMDVTKLPGCGTLPHAFFPTHIPTNDANRLAFRRAYQWSASSLWNLGLDGEINIGAGKALYRRAAAKRNKAVLPMWTCQDHLNQTHPFAWFGLASQDNSPAVMEKLAQDLGMNRVDEDEGKTYKVTVMRARDTLDLELNEQLQPQLVNKMWERIYCGHYVRNHLPDLRFLVRARLPVKQKVVETYMASKMIDLKENEAQSVLSPDLGDVQYCCERQRRRWSTQLDCGVTLSILETKRLPLIISNKDDTGERLEYEFIANVPRQVEKVDMHSLADELWLRGTQMATVLEEGMADFNAHTMSSSAAFEKLTFSNRS